MRYLGVQRVYGNENLIEFSADNLEMYYDDGSTIPELKDNSFYFAVIKNHKTFRNGFWEIDFNGNNYIFKQWIVYEPLIRAFENHVQKYKREQKLKRILNL